MYFVLFVFLFSSYVLAHQSSLTGSGRELFWANPNIAISIRGTTSDLSTTAVNSIIQSSMNQWNTSTRARLNNVSSSQNEIRFVSNFPYGSGVVGVTEVTYNGVGAISKAVISLNDDFTFRATEGIYSGPQIYLGDVVTHEFGHLLGLSHSEVMNASMFYASFSGQSTLALDDKTGIRQKYDGGGQITGRVKGGSHIGVLGVHVQAISRKTGEATAAVTDENGNFKLGGLDLNDTYYLYTSPLKKVSSLPEFYANVQDEFCPGSYVGSFYSACGRDADGKPTGLNLTPETSAIDVGTVSISCVLRSDLLYSEQKDQSSFSALTIYDYGLEQKFEKSFVGWFYPPTSTAWSPADVLRVDLSEFHQLGGNPKFLKLSLVSFPLGTQLEYEMNVRHNGLSVSSASRSLIGPRSDDTYMPDFDSFLMLDGDPLTNVFEIDVRSKKLTPYYLALTFPTTTNFTSDQHLPYLLVASVWELTSQGLKPLMDTESNLSDNESCLDAPYTFAVAKSEKFEESSRASAAAAATCGTIGPGGRGPTSSLPLMVAGFLMAMTLSSFSKRRKNFLS